MSYMTAAHLEPQQANHSGMAAEERLGIISA
jgi:hypothetical protein